MSEPSARPEPSETDGPGKGQGQGKGRPTPKRREAQKRRRQPVPTNRKDAAKVRRESMREQRQLQRKALLSGDERHLPARDAGPAKRLARDVVDTRFTLGQIFFGLIIAVFVASIATSPRGKNSAHQANTLGALITMLSIVLLIAVFVDSIRVGRKAKRVVTERLGAKQALGVTGYAAIRAMQPRRLRRPPPARKRGEQPR